MPGHETALTRNRESGVWSVTGSAPGATMAYDIMVGKNLGGVLKFFMKVVSTTVHCESKGIPLTII
jgi:hypothetical protein